MNKLLYTFHQKFMNSSGNNNNSKNKKIFKLKNQFFGFFIIIILLVWIISGLYITKESDRFVVSRFGKFNRISNPGLNWRATFVEKIIPVDVEAIREQTTNGMMLTSDENIIQVEMNVQYRITNPTEYLFNVTNPDNSLRQAMDSAVRGIIGQSKMEQVLTTKRSFIRNETQRELEKAIKKYNMGISILDINFQKARPPEAVKASFDDVIAAREEEQKTIREAQSYKNEVLPLAKGNAQKIIEDAKAYKLNVILKSEGEISKFSKILPEYHKAPQITKTRLYLETMEKILNNVQKIIINEKNINTVLLPLNQLLNKNFQYKPEDNNNIPNL